MTTIAKWEPMSDIPDMLHLESILYGSGGLKVLLKGETETGKMLSIHFKNFLGFRTFDESYRLKTLSENPILSSPDAPWTLFTSEDDDFIQWLTDENYDILDRSRGFKNYIIGTSDEVIDIISDVPPIVEWV